jgi:hypothetical protein
MGIGEWGLGIGKNLYNQFPITSNQSILKVFLKKKRIFEFIRVFPLTLSRQNLNTSFVRKDEKHPE